MLAQQRAGVASSRLGSASQRLQGGRRGLAFPSRGRKQLQVANAYEFDVSVRPYTLRRGDTLQSIAEKRDLTLRQIRGVNHGVNLDALAEGQTILLPAGKLSARDREILSGISTAYRLYPVRKGERLDDIISKRKISRAEMEAINPGIKLDKLKENQLLKLPAGKFTVREREMLIGSGILPREFFEVARNPYAIAGGVLMLVCGFVMAWQRFYDEDAAEDAEDELTA